MSKLQPVRGTKDILPSDHRVFSSIIKTAKDVASLYGFEQITTPIFEFTEVFKRTLGEASDIVSKEMYTFDDRGGEGITLRPEFTAGIARAFISEGLSQHVPLKLFATGPLFRYERPQKGRQRQFNQINFEIIGVDSYIADVELISLGSQILKELGLENKVKLEINSLGDKASRVKYRDALVAYLEKYKNDLSDDSKVRLTQNPMRILDSKDEGDKKIVADAPLIAEYYSDEAKEFFANVKSGLGLLDIEYKVNAKLVRGLDYYCHTAFEFTTEHLGAQNAVLAGGRYDGLIEQMGGPAAPAVGFAGGVERLLALVDAEKFGELVRPVVIVPIGQNAEKEALLLSKKLRDNNIYAELGYSGNVSKRMKKADKMNAKAAIIFGDEEINQKIFKVKLFDKSEEKEVDADSLVEFIKNVNGE